MKKNNLFRGLLLKLTAIVTVIAIASCNKSDSILNEDALTTSGTGKSSAMVLANANEVRAGGGRLHLAYQQC